MKIRKGIIILLTLTIAILLAGCGGPPVELKDQPEIDYGESLLYTKEDMDAVIPMIEEQMQGWNISYNIQSIRYGGDALAEKGMAYVATMTEGYDYSGCLVFLVDFVSLSKGSGYEKNKLYEDYEWYFVRDEKDDWLFFTNGHIAEYMLDDSTAAAN